MVVNNETHWIDDQKGLWALLSQGSFSVFPMYMGVIPDKIL